MYNTARKNSMNPSVEIYKQSAEKIPTNGLSQKKRQPSAKGRGLVLFLGEKHFMYAL